MNKFTRSICGLSLSLLLVPTCQSKAEETPKYLNPNVPIEERIDDLLPRMTLEEKVTQVYDDWGSKGVARLKIPPLLKTEGLHSQSYSTGATIFPHAIARAATFDLELEGQIGKQTAVEAKAANIRGSWSPVLDVIRDVRWGRSEETYGESPYLVGRMGVAWIEAFQGEGMVAVPKHFAGHGQPVGGRDSNDYGLSDRTMREVHLPPFRDAIVEAKAGGIMAAYGLWEGVPDNASNTLLRKILRQEWGFDGMVVSDCGGPEHFIVKHGVVSTPAEAAALAVAAGVNMECGNIYKKGGIVAALEQGLITEDQLNDLVRAIMRTKMRLGLFEKSGPQNMEWKKLPEYDTAESRALARKAAVESIVMLKNDKNLLPLKKDLKTIAVIGPNANEGQTGDYSPKLSDGQLVTVLQGIKSHVGKSAEVLYAEGVADPSRVPDAVQFTDSYYDGNPDTVAKVRAADEAARKADVAKIAEAVEVAKKADVVVLVVGDHSFNGSKFKSTTGENVDGASLDFPGAQRELIRAVQATGKPVVLVIVNGKPFTLAWENENVPAILVTWYPGEEGGNAAADILFGDVNPSGRLPMTWPRHVGQTPMFFDYKPSGRRYDYWDMRSTPQYRFGYGLSYTQFKYSNLKTAPSAKDSNNVTVSVDIENAGNRDGAEVAQLYITDLISSVSTPIIELKGFQRVELKKGEKKTVNFELTPYSLSLLDAKMVRRVEPGVFRVHVGGVCPDVENERGNDERKPKIGFRDPLVGISGEFTVSNAYSADFDYSMDVPDKVSGGQPFPVKVTVKNSGNLTDVTEVKLFGDFELDSWSFELKPGESKSHTFNLSVYKSGNLSLVAGSAMISKALTVEKSPAKLVFNKTRMQVDETANLQVTAEAQNIGSAPYEGNLQLKVDGKPVGKPQDIKLQSGEKKKISLGYVFEVGGLYKVQINDMAEQQIVIPGGIGLGLKNPLIYVKLDEGSGSNTKNEITGQNLSIKGSPAWMAGKNGKALQLTKEGMAIDAGSADIYRKSFTLSALVKIDQFGEKNQLALFGGRAPMGADQDNTGTVLQVGIKDKKPFMGFFGRDISGGKEVSQSEWVNLTYVYDAQALKGTFYINGNKDKEDNQKPYTGPLETIGDSPMLKHGSYLLDEAVVVQDSLSPRMVKQLAEKGFESLRQGEYSSDWRPADEIKSLDAAAEIPQGTAITVTVETGKDGKATSSSMVKLSNGRQSYPLSGLKKDEQVRVKVKLENSGWGANPVLRAAVIGSQKWSSSSDWGKGTADGDVITDAGQ